MIQLIDWASKGLILLLLVLAGIVVIWQCCNGLSKITIIGREFIHFIVNRRNFDRWKKAMAEQEKRERDEC